MLFSERSWIVSWGHMRGKRELVAVMMKPEVIKRDSRVNTKKGRIWLGFFITYNQ